MYNFQEDFLKFIIKSWQSYVLFNTQCHYFSIIFLRYPFQIKLFVRTILYIIFSILLSITSLVPFLNQNLKCFTMETTAFWEEMILYLLDILWECTNTCRCGQFFKPLYRLQSSSVFLTIRNLTNQLGIFMTISSGKDALYLSILCFPVLEFFAWQIVILQECTNFVTLP